MRITLIGIPGFETSELIRFDSLFVLISKALVAAIVISNFSFIAVTLVVVTVAAVTVAVETGIAVTAGVVTDVVIVRIVTVVAPIVGTIAMAARAVRVFGIINFYVVIVFASLIPTDVRVVVVCAGVLVF